MLVSFCLQLRPVMKWGDCGQQKKSISRNRICAFNLVKYLKELAAFEMAVDTGRKDCIYVRYRERQTLSSMFLG